MEERQIPAKGDYGDVLGAVTARSFMSHFAFMSFLSQVGRQS